MSKKVSPVTLPEILSAERAHLLASNDIAARVTRWMNAEIAAFAAKHARDASHATALGTHLRDAIVDACKEVAARPAKDGGLGRSAAKLADMSAWDIVEAVLGSSKKATWKNYVSGAKLAFIADVEWTPSVYRTLKKKDADPKAPGKVEKVDPAKVAPESQPKQSTAPATNGTVKTDALQAVMLAAMVTEERTKELIAFAKAKGWL